MKLPGKCFLVLVIASLGILSAEAQDSRKVKEAKKKAEKKRELQLDQAYEARDKRIQEHFNMQSKEVQKRLKQSAKKTDKHYGRKNFINRVKSVFSKPRKRYGR